MKTLPQLIKALTSNGATYTTTFYGRLLISFHSGMCHKVYRLKDGKAIELTHFRDGNDLIVYNSTTDFFPLAVISLDNIPQHHLT